MMHSLSIFTVGYDQNIQVQTIDKAQLNRYVAKSNKHTFGKVALS